MPLFTETARFTNSREVVLAVHRLLISKLAGYDIPQERIVIADPEQWEDGPPTTLIDETLFTVCPGDSEFPEDVQIGGGLNTIEEIAAIEVTIFAARRLDQNGTMPAAIYDENDGLLEQKRRVMKALCQADPTGDNALPLLSQFAPIRTSSKPRKDSTGLFILRLIFGTPFFWDLS